MNSLKKTLNTHVHTRELALTDAHLATAALPIQFHAKIKASWRMVRLSFKWGWSGFGMEGST